MIICRIVCIHYVKLIYRKNTAVDSSGQKSGGKCDWQKGQKRDVTDSSDDEQPPVKVT